MAEKARRLPAPIKPFTKPVFARLTLRSVRTLERGAEPHKGGTAKRFDEDDARQHIRATNRIGSDAVLYFLAVRGLWQVAYLVQLEMLPRPASVDLATDQWIWTDGARVLATCERIRAADVGAFKSQAEFDDYRDGVGGHASLEELGTWHASALDTVQATKAAEAEAYAKRKQRQRDKAEAERARAALAEARADAAKRQAAEFRELDALPTRTAAQKARHALLVPVHCPRYREAQRLARASKDAARAALRRELDAYHADKRTTVEAIAETRDNDTKLDLYAELSDLDTQARALAHQLRRLG